MHGESCNENRWNREIRTWVPAMRRKLAVCLSTFVVLLITYSHVALAQDTNPGKDGQRYGGTYRAPLLNNPSNLDPANAQDVYAIEVIQQIFDGLVQFSPDLFVMPALAKNWEVGEKGKTYRFFLREDATFHNGTPITSKDVVFSLTRLLKGTSSSTILPHLLKIKGAQDYLDGKADHVAGLEAPDSHTVIARLDQPYVPFLVALGMYQAKIVPMEEVSKDEKHFSHEPVGSGPFQFVAWEPNKRINLKCFTNYYRGRAFLDAIEFVIYPGIQIEDVWVDFDSGKLDQMPIYGAIRQKAEGKEGIQLVHRPSLSLQFYGINCQNARLKDPDLRKALSLAIDREGLVAEVLKGQFEVARSILPPGMPGYQPDYNEVIYDLAKAREHLARAASNNPNSLADIEIVSNSQSPIAQAELEFVGRCWAKLGIKLKPKFIPDWSQFENYLNSDSLQIYRYALFADMPDPDDVLRPLFASYGVFNYMRYRDSKVDQMLQQALGIVDAVERARYYQDIENIVQNSYPIIPLIYLSKDFAYRTSVQGIQLSASGVANISFYQVWLKKTQSK